MVLRRIARADTPAPAGADLLENSARPLVLLRKQSALHRAFLDRTIDIAEAYRLAELNPCIEIFQNQPRMFARFHRAFDRHMIAVRIGGHAQSAFELRKVLIILSEDERGMAIIVERQGYLGGAVLNRRTPEFLLRKRR